MNELLHCGRGFSPDFAPGASGLKPLPQPTATRVCND